MPTRKELLQVLHDHGTFESLTDIAIATGVKRSSYLSECIMDFEKAGLLETFQNPSPNQFRSKVIIPDRERIADVLKNPDRIPKRDAFNRTKKLKRENSENNMPAHKTTPIYLSVHNIAAFGICLGATEEDVRQVIAELELQPARVHTGTDPVYDPIVIRKYWEKKTSKRETRGRGRPTKRV